MIAVYGLNSCDTCRKARKWLESEGIAHRFHDVRADGLEAAVLDRWLADVGWEALLNRRSTTWRGLPRADTENVDAAGARALMLAHPALVRRPVFDFGNRVLIGFGDAERRILGATC